MAFFTVKTDNESISDSSGNSASSYLNKSGIYEVLVKALVVDTSPKGSKYLNMVLEHDGRIITIYQAIRLYNNNNSENFEIKLFNKFCIVAGMTKDDQVSEPVPMLLPIGKGGENKECMVLDQFLDVPMCIRIQMEYSMYDGKIQERRTIRNFFRIPDYATAEEIVNKDSEIGKQYEQESEKFADKVTYRDNLTAEDIAEWIKNGRNSNKDKEDSTPKEATKLSFGKRTFAH